MREDDLIATFDRQAASYDQHWVRMALVLGAIYQLVESIFAELPYDARVLCVGAGTGAELVHLAKRFSGWSFTAVEPSSKMLEECRRRVEREGFAARCSFHSGYLDSLPASDGHHAATCFLVSQFIVDAEKRSAFFRSIAERLEPGGILATSDLAADHAGFERPVQFFQAGLLHAWVSVSRARGA